MNPTLMQELGATIAADRRREAERARQAAGRPRGIGLLRRRRRRPVDDLPARVLDPAPRA
jgi:hypothetical protein